jgi:GT2 family glycosyltransferase
MAHCEIFVLNYNGSYFLRECLENLKGLNCLSHSYSVNVIDNGSTDASSAIVRSDFADFNVTALDANYGFAKGNNLGVSRRAKELKKQGKPAHYYAFLNNDTAVSSDWLTSALEVFSQDPKIGIVGSKSLFYDRFAKLRLETDVGFVPAQNVDIAARKHGLFFLSQFAGSNVFASLTRSKLPQGFSFPEEKNGLWLPAKCDLYVAINNPALPSHVELVLENHHPDLAERTLRVYSGEKTEPILHCSVSRDAPCRAILELEPSDYHQLIQNAGSILHPDWLAGDRGYLETDCGQCDTQEDVDAVCGVSLFIKSSLWKRLGGFDNHYFAYYEDTDLSLRARLLGYRCVYCPRSQLRHVHCGSCAENTEGFIDNVTYSHLIFCSKMMNKKDWVNRLELYRERAKEEFELFKVDHSLDHKPFLRAYCRYVKYFPYFLSNRLFNLRWNPEKRLFPLIG